MILGILMSNEVKIAVLETQVERLLEKQKDLTERVRANEKVVAAIGLLGSIAIAVIGAGYFAPSAEALPEKQQPYDGLLPDNTQTINNWITRMKQWELEQTIRDPEFDINKALEEFFNGSNDPTEQEELLQLSSSED